MIKIKYVDFWPDGVIDGEGVYFKYLSDICEAYEGDDPDFIICSCYGTEFIKYECPRIQFIWENTFPDFNLYDYVISSHHIELSERYYRYPLYAVGKNVMEAREKHLKFDGRRREKFCNIIVSNARPLSADPIREQFFRKLDEYKHVDSGGKAWNNIGGRVEDKRAFQENYRFTIAFENSSVPGYITEKIVDAWVAGTIPIYWGAPDIAREFNPKSFINCHDYENFDQVIKRIDEIENNDELYFEIMREPILKEDSLAHNYRTAKLIDYLKEILLQKPEAALRRPRYGRAGGYQSKIKRQILASNANMEGRKNV